MNFKDIFPRASKSFLDANPLPLPSKPNKTLSRPSQTPRNGKPETNETPNRSEIPNPEPKHHQTPALDSTNAGKEKGVRRVIVRFIGFRVRPLDPDNFAGGCKDLLDGLRHSGLIPGDEPWKIDFQTRQEKVAHRSEEKTIIKIEYP